MLNPPKIELIIIFSTFFNGTIKILPKIKIKHIQAKKVIIFVFILSTPIKNDNNEIKSFIITICMLDFGQILLILLLHFLPKKKTLYH